MMMMMMMMYLDQVGEYIFGSGCSPKYDLDSFSFIYEQFMFIRPMLYVSEFTFNVAVCELRDK